MYVFLQEKAWCVAKPSSNDATLLENINYACSIVDCGVLKHGGTCFFPNNLISHASVAMNLYYQSSGKNPWNCYFKASGLVTKINPSKIDLFMFLILLIDSYLPKFYVLIFFGRCWELLLCIKKRTWSHGQLSILCLFYACCLINDPHMYLNINLPL